jgi:hypothetical protein
LPRIRSIDELTRFLDPDWGSPINDHWQLPDRKFRNLAVVVADAGSFEWMCSSTESSLVC